MKFSETISEGDKVKTMEKHGVQKEPAKKYASKIFKSIAGQPFKRITIFVTAGSAFYTIEEWAFLYLRIYEKLAIAIAGGLITLWIFLKLAQKGITK